MTVEILIVDRAEPVRDAEGRYRADFAAETRP